MDEYTFVTQTARKAGELLLTARQIEFKVGFKGGNLRDVVTSTDREVNDLLLAEIKKVFPADGIYSEEGGNVDGGARVWTVDPIDGSSNFSRGIPHYAVVLGLIENKTPVVGAVYNPVTNELFSFQKGNGVFLNNQPIRVSDVSELSKAQAVFSPGSRKPELWDWAATSYRRLLEHTLKRGMYGSSSLDICFIASGRADVGVFGTLSTLDIAPALGILCEAGGVACGADGKLPTYSEKSQKIFLANNSAMLDAVRALVES